jgi:hypothetical protein
VGTKWARFLEAHYRSGLLAALYPPGFMSAGVEA